MDACVRESSTHSTSAFDPHLSLMSCLEIRPKSAMVETQDYNTSAAVVLLQSVPAACRFTVFSGEAWESQGGGKFSRKPDMSQVPAHIRAKGWSDAKAFAATMLRKNPNTYFYRHVAPHEQQVSLYKWVTI